MTLYKGLTLGMDTAGLEQSGIAQQTFDMRLENKRVVTELSRAKVSRSYVLALRCDFSIIFRWY